MTGVPNIRFVLPQYLSANNSIQLFSPTYRTLTDIQITVSDLYQAQTRLKRSLDGNERQGKRYLVYDRPTEKKKKKRRQKCPSSNGISAFTFLNFAIGAVSLAANVVNNINSNQGIFTFVICDDIHHSLQNKLFIYVHLKQKPE